MSGEPPTELPPADDDATVIGDGAARGATAPDTSGGHNALPVGTRLGEFEIIALIGEGGFGIVYLAQDHALQRRVALKEYLPASLAGRSGGLAVSVLSERHTETFQAGLRSFVNEARLLAQFDHPSLVKVYRFWEANGTAYMVMPYYQGLTLREALKELGKPPDEAWLKGLLANLLDALAVLHGAQCLHRDIAPDNILLLASGRPVLLDFGAARRVIGDRSQALTVILKPGYAPVEQYADASSMKQGPWTDLYALASVAYFAVTGQRPTPSVARLMSDPMAPLARAAAGRYSAKLLEGLDRALAVKPEDRPQDTDALRKLLGLERRSVPRPPGGGERPRSTATVPAPDPSSAAKRSPRGKVWVAAGIALVVLAGGAATFLLTRRGEAPPPPTVENAPEEPARSAAAPPEAPTPAAPASPTTSATPAVGPATPASGTPPAAPSSADVASPSTPPTAVAIPSAPARAPYDPIRGLDNVFEGRSREHAVTVSVPEARLRVGQDQLRFSVRSAKPGYLYLLMVGTDRSQFFLLFPNSLDKDNRIEPGQDLELPRPKWRITAAGPPGTDHFVTIVSDRPRDFAAAGLTPLEPFAEFPAATAARLYRDHAGTQPLFAGTPVCPAATPCSDRYGAAVFSIEEVQRR